MMKNRYFIWCVLVMLSSLGFTQPGSGTGFSANRLPRFPKFSYLRPADGLSSSWVIDMLQDKEGFIWMATDDGLNRYDGRQYMIFRKKHGLDSNRINALCEDEAGNLWVSTEAGINLLRSGAKRFESATPINLQSWFDEVGVVSSLAVLDDKLYLAAERGFFRLQFIDQHWELEILMHLHAHDVKVIDDHTLWLATVQGVFSYRHGKILPVPQLSEEIGKLFIGKDNIWCSTTSGLIFRYDRDSEAIAASFSGKQELWARHPVNDLFPDKTGRLWVTTFGDGLHVLDGETLHYLSGYHHKNGVLSGLSTNNLNSLLISRSGIIWVGTVSTGCDYLDLSSPRQQFQLIKNAPDQNLDLKVSGIQGIHVEADGSLYLSMDGAGLFILVPDETKEQGYRITEQFDADDLPNVYPHAIVAQNDSIYWIPGWGGISRLNKKRRSITNFSPLKEDGDAYNIQVLCRDPAGRFWMGSRAGGLGYFDPAEYPNIVFHWLSETPTGKFPQKRVEALLLDDKNRLWIGTGGEGLTCLSADRQRLTHFRHLPSDSTSISSDFIYSLYQSDPHTLWIGTHSGGLNKLDIGTGYFNRYTTEQGLPNNVIYNILPDKTGKLWLSTNQGLSRFDPEHEVVRNFDVRDGLQSNEFNRYAAHLGPDGRLYFGGIKGLNFFDPGKIQDNDYIPPLVFTGFRVNQKESYVRDGMKLKHDENLLEFKFAALSYRQPSKNLYRYQLIGADQGWSDVSTQNKVIYSHLRPGNYTFEVQGSNNDCQWNRESLRFQFRILPPWWKTWWAHSAYILIAILTIQTVYRFQLKQKIAESEAGRLKDLHQLKSRLYTNITHEFRTPLSIILGITEQTKSLVQERAIANLQMIERNGRQLLHLVNQLLDLAKLESGNLELQYIQGDLIKFLKYLAEAFHSLAENKHITLHFLSEEDTLMMDFDQNCLQQIFYNLVANALKFTPEGGHIYLQVKKADIKGRDHLVIKLKDTGIGIPEQELPKIFEHFYQADSSSTRSAEGSGIGLALVKELIHLMKGTIQVKSRPENGTTFIISLPITREALPKQPLLDSLPVSAKNYSPSRRSQPLETIGDRPRVLVIEDNPDVLEYIRNCLAGYYHMEEAVNGEEGIRQARKNIPDLVISDVMMPLKDGFEVCETLKSDRLTSHIPILMLTAKVDRDSKLKGLTKGADIYLPKPFYEEELLLQLNNLLLHRNRLKNYYLFQSGFATDRPEHTDTSGEDSFMEEVKAIILLHLSDSTFSVARLSKEMVMSQSQLHRKLKALTGYSANKLIRLIRLQQAKSLLENKTLTIASVAYDSGFSNPDYFSRVFKKKFGVSPSDFRESL